ncbi:MAG: hypothetical protein GX153_09770 [Clostridiaceae bacterium]|nr:hypothetical protein [Clostridiaceae bacterium]
MLRNGIPSDGTDLVFDDGLAFGRGAFETLLVTIRPRFLDRHCARLNATLSRLGLACRVDPSAIARLADLHNLRHCVLKILVTEHNELLVTRPLPYTAAQYRQGFRLATAKTRRHADAVWVAHKTLNYLENLTAREEAVQLGADDALFLNERGDIAETSSGNLFAVMDDRLVTPDPSCGLLPGILRAWVMETLPVAQERLSYAALLHAQEVFVTNSVVGVMPVSSIDGISVRMPDTGVTRTLSDRLAALP